MSIFSQNILRTAQNLIPKQSFKYLKYLGNNINEFGINVPTYAEPVVVEGNIQPPELSLYDAAGLDFSKNYRQIFVSLDVSGIEKQSQPDRFVFENKTWEVVKNSPWYEFNGWNSILVVEIKELRDD